jgi:hypothetical protein
MGIIEIVGPGVVGRQGFNNDQVTSPAKIEYDYDNQKIYSITARNNIVNLNDLIIEPNDNLQEGIDFWACIALLTNYRNALLADEEEIAPFIPNGYKLVFELDEWEHPDWNNPPSKTQTFVELSLALATGDFSKVKKCQKPNTHWSNWLPK